MATKIFEIHFKNVVQLWHVQEDYRYPTESERKLKKKQKISIPFPPTHSDSYLTFHRGNVCLTVTNGVQISKPDLPITVNDLFSIA